MFLLDQGTDYLEIHWFPYISEILSPKMALKVGQFSTFWKFGQFGAPFWGFKFFKHMETNAFLGSLFLDLKSIFYIKLHPFFAPALAKKSFFPLETWKCSLALKRTIYISDDELILCSNFFNFVESVVPTAPSHIPIPDGGRNNQFSWASNWAWQLLQIVLILFRREKCHKKWKKSKIKNLDRSLVIYFSHSCCKMPITDSFHFYEILDHAMNNFSGKDLIRGRQRKYPTICAISSCGM